MDYFYEQLKKWANTNELLYIQAVLEKKERELFIGRIIQFNKLEQTILIYKDDSKTVEHIRLNEIDDITPAKI